MGVCGQLSGEWVKGKLNVTTDGVMLDGVIFIRQYFRIVQVDDVTSYLVMLKNSRSIMGADGYTGKW